MKYKCIAFDMDGTLLNSEKAGLLSLQKTIEVFLGKKMELEELHFSLGIPGEKAIAMLGFEDDEKAVAYWDDLYLEMKDGITKFDGCDLLLASLKEKGYLLGLVTSGFKKDVENHLVRLGLDVYFDVIVTAQDTLKHKPEADPLLKLMECLHLDSGEVMYIGDSVYDSMCAHNANVDFGLALWGSVNKEIAAKYYVEKVLDVLEIV